MRLNEIIVQEAVLTELKGRTIQEVLAELIEALKNAGRLPQPDMVLKDLFTAERKGSSGIGQGVAIPHACSASVHQPIIAFGKSRTGIDFQAIDGKSVNFIFLVLGRINGQGLQLKILGRLAHLFNIPGFLETLHSIESAKDLLAFLKQQEESLGEIEVPEGMPSICVAGAGNGGLAMAGHLTLVGCQVNLFVWE